MNRALEEFVQSHPLHAPDISLDLAQVIGGLRPVPDGRDRSGVALVKEHGLNMEAGTFTEDRPELGIQAGDIIVDLPDLLVRLELASGKGEGRKLLEQGSIAIDGRRLVPGPAGVRAPANVRDGSVVRRGPRRHKRVRFRD